MPEAALEREQKTYEAHRGELLAQAPGKFVLIRDEDVIETFDTKSDAISSGYRHFGNSPFLVKEIVAVDIPQNFVSNHLAV